MTYAKGLHRPDPEKLKRRLHAATHPILRQVVAAASPSGNAAITPCARLDQGASGTCHAHSGVGAVWSALNAAGKPLAWIPSPLLLASTTYADVRAAAHPTGELPPLQDTGADLSDDAQALARWGIAPMKAPVQGRNSDVPADPPDGTFPEPDLTQLEIAGADLIGGEYQIPVDNQAPRLCALAIEAGFPIWLGFFCDSAFEAIGATDVAQPPNESDPSGGGHAVYLSAYRTATDGSFEWRVENSWGEGWADHGAVWASTAWLLKCWMLWPCAVKVQS